MARDCCINHHTLLKMKSYSVDFRQKIIGVAELGYDKFIVRSPQNNT